MGSKVITKKLIKNAIREGKSLKRSMLEAGLAMSTANHGRACVVANEAEREVEREINSKTLTVDYVIAGLIRLMEDKNTKSSDKVQVFNLLGKYLKMFTENDQKPLISINTWATELPQKVDNTTVIETRPVDNPTTGVNDTTTALPST